MGYLDKTKTLIKSRYRLKKNVIAKYIVLYIVKLCFNDNQYFYVYLYWGKSQMGHYNVPCLQINTQKYFQFLFFSILTVYCYK